MQMICHHCGNEIPAEKVNQEKRYASCPTCNSIYTLNEANELLPMGVRVEHEGNDLLIHRKWLSCIGYGLLAFAFFWNIAIFACVVPILGGVSSSILLFLSPFILGGLIAAYIGLAYSLNTTKIRVTHEMISVEHKPIPYSPSSKIAIGDVQQLSTRKLVVRGARSTSVMYQIWAIRNDGTEVKVVDRLEQPEFALFIEKEIERYMGIQNRPVDGEYQIGQ